MSKRIYVAGHSGMVGSAICRKLRESDEDVVLITARHDELDLKCQASVKAFFHEQSIDSVYLAAAKVGGIHANNTYPADFIYDNLMIEANIVHAAHQSGVQRLLFLGSSCIYPKFAEQPIKEESLLQGALEPTNEAYAIAKIAGIKLCESYNRQYARDYRSVMPTNLYGPGDNFHPENSHVIPAMLRRFHEAVSNGSNEVIIWGSGNPLREFLHVDDMADACLHVMNIGTARHGSCTQENLSHLNVGTGIDCSISELATTIAEVTGYQGKLVFDTSKPDGTPRKLLDVSRINSLGWKAKTPLREGLSSTYRWFLDNETTIRQ